MEGINEILFTTKNLGYAIAIIVEIISIAVTVCLYLKGKKELEKKKKLKWWEMVTILLGLIIAIPVVVYTNSLIKVPSVE